MGGANIHILHYFGHGYIFVSPEGKINDIQFQLLLEQNIWTSVSPSQTVSLIKNNILHQSKNYKYHFENSNFWGHVTYSFINMLFISTGIFMISSTHKCCPCRHYRKFPFNIVQEKHGQIQVQLQNVLLHGYNFFITYSLVSN